MNSSAAQLIITLHFGLFKLLSQKTLTTEAQQEAKKEALFEQVQYDL